MSTNKTRQQTGAPVLCNLQTQLVECKRKILPFVELQLIRLHDRITAMSTVLLPDETHCRSELGAILYRDRKNYAFSAQILEVTEPGGFFGHVEYKIGICMDPVNVHQFEWRRFDLTTRFRDVHRLHQQLSTIHRQLYLKDKIPEMSSPKLFGSTAAETIEERKRTIVQFLNFVLRNDVLCKARIFQSFVDSSREKSPEPSTSEPPVELTNETKQSPPGQPIEDELD
ncbi:PX domain protein [Aphelenchoides besseyi]|nr:PX domain protein [Aphelenchoides besseyi]KAI6199727.1 PX domain protein [Aphelenchoides besseyi]